MFSHCFLGLQKCTVSGTVLNCGGGGGGLPNTHSLNWIKWNLKHHHNMIIVHCIKYALLYLPENFWAYEHICIEL